MGKPKTQTSPYELRLGRAASRRKRRVLRSPTSIVQRQGDRSSADDDGPRKFLTGPQVCQRYAISDMSLWRWLQDAELSFPQPALRVRDRRYWLESDLVRWELSHVLHGTRRAMADATT
jgi:predicted DNA-binding transcriptional regulator AlpA